MYYSEEKKKIMGTSKIWKWLNITIGMLYLINGIKTTLNPRYDFIDPLYIEILNFGIAFQLFFVGYILFKKTDILGLKIAFYSSWVLLIILLFPLVIILGYLALYYLTEVYSSAVVFSRFGIGALIVFFTGVMYLVLVSVPLVLGIKNIFLLKRLLKSY